MAKIPSVDQLEELTNLLNQINRKISSAKVLNGGFDKLEIEVDEIKKAQLRLIVDFENSKFNAERMESKLDKIFDPEDGLYHKINKTEAALENLGQRFNNLAVVDEKVMTRLSTVENLSETTTGDLAELKKITGQDHDALRKSIKISNGVWWLIAMTTTGLIGAIGKLIWDFFIG